VNRQNGTGLVLPVFVKAERFLTIFQSMAIVVVTFLVLFPASQDAKHRVEILQGVAFPRGSSLALH
jgi:hypothetical protein